VGVKSPTGYQNVLVHHASYRSRGGKHTKPMHDERPSCLVGFADVAGPMRELVNQTAREVGHFPIGLSGFCH
jgi:hypothetical protein